MTNARENTTTIIRAVPGWHLLFLSTETGTLANGQPIRPPAPKPRGSWSYPTPGVH